MVFPLSEEERWRAQQNAGNVSMVNQSSMTPEQRAILRERAAYNPKSREAILAAQLRAGRENLNSQGPRGKQVGNIYAAPTWSENLASAVRKGLGGLDMRDARRGLDDVQMQRRAAEAAQGQLDEYADSQAVEQRGIDNSLRQQGMGFEGRRAQVAEDRLAADKANEMYGRSRDVVGDERYAAEQEVAREEARLERESAENIARLRNANSGKSGASTAKEREKEKATENAIELAKSNILKIQALDDKGKASSGFRAVITEMSPKALQGAVSSWLYDKDEEAQRAANSVIDTMVSEMLVTGVLSDTDRKLLKSAMTAEPGISPPTQVARLEAIVDILERNKSKIDDYYADDQEADTKSGFTDRDAERLRELEEKYGQE